MLSLAAFRYRNIFADHGGPIDSVEFGEFSVCGRPMIQANAKLVSGLTAKGERTIYGSADGSGTHRLASVARHMAISEALERWAFHSVAGTVRAAEFGFDVDPSSNGMSAFPGIFARHARRKAMLEAVERFSLIAWWEGRAVGKLCDTDWPGVSAVAIEGPFGGVTALVFAKTDFGMYAYGHAAEETFGAACERALVELARHDSVMREWWRAKGTGETRMPQDLFERRCLFFSTEEGHEQFLHRIKDRPIGKAPKVELVCDCEIPGLWSDYATVWRHALRPPADGFLYAGDDYFFW